uniref:NADH dehydrogenase subunit 6 n=1 Tax=Meloe proscarabaeus TaxID=34751 RepID=UPI0022386886|nr:NADH dehydrogenase subunit 6 [Meloe proscarabaeus]UYA96977.1 NADH dehydrogenase subunit 6 [Meloe proscarabaeus]
MSLMVTSIIMSIIFITLSHPLSLGLILLIQTTIISLMTGKFCLNFWFSYIVFLIMIGGMLILFIYMTSIASNEKFVFKLKSTIPMMALLICPGVPTLLLFLPDNSIKNDMFSFKTDYLTISMIKYTYMPASMILMFTIIYLLITLIVIVKIISIKNGPLRTSH